MTHPHSPEHPHQEPWHKDEGSLQDLIQSLSRRRTLAMLGTVAFGSSFTAACGGGGGGGSTTTSVTTTSASSSSSGSSSSSSSSASSSSASSSGTCTTYPSETQGPYPGDGSNTVSGTVINALALSGINRADIRTSVGSASGTAPGLPVQLTITVVNSANGCTPLAGYAVYLWHCTRDGLYSLYSSGVTGENYLRGVQVTNASGQVTFTTIFPGCYSGRMPHLHVEVYPNLAAATSYANKLFTSQFALDRTVCSTVYSSVTGYSASVSNLAAISFATDNVFSDNSSAQLAAQTIALSGNTTSGYTGTVTLGMSI
ncbi:intradiol ring-cleavage dioxygenase [Asticcacaulis sp. AND118]|uniref:dioxygenase family protein n=1 Tax=Asticcacaulis sp. AND118 TaxID=2840468 RepID=UPI001D00077B|nr:intradiol ring-cleavage dioxygenase [Asticcacaulis sp. AND118]UDF05240.1 intradiol ring-cleavage dioxygenase [Asticcacaulis sp. AND118]